MSFHYTHEAGADGQILTEDGDGPGQALSEILRSGSVPVRAALELVASVADILTIAEEDKAVHGDLKVGCIRVDAKGAVTVDGYGVKRPVIRAPEGKPQGVATDIYGLGVVLHACLSSTGLGAIPREKAAHDAYVLRAFQELDWGELRDKPWLDSVSAFCAKAMSFEPVDRPTALDVANVLGHVVAQTQGDGLVAWARGTMGGPRRVASARPEVEQLPQPRPMPTPLSHTAAIRVRKTASSRGEATQMWSRERIAALVKEDPTPDGDSGASSRPVAPTSSSQVVSPGGPPRRSEPPRPSFGGGAPPPPPSIPAAPQRPQATLPMSEAPYGPGGASSPRVVAQVGVGPDGSRPKNKPTPATKAEGTRWGVVATVLLVLAVLGCGGLGVVGGAVYWMRSKGSLSMTDEGGTPTTGTGAPPPQSTETPSEPSSATADAVPVETGDEVPKDSSAAAGTTGAKPTDASKGSGSSKSGSAAGAASTSSDARGLSVGTAVGGSGEDASSGAAASSRSTTGSGGSSASTGSASSGSASSGSVPATGVSSGATKPPYSVTFNIAGPAKVQCGDGQESEFASSTSMTFREVTTCRMKTDGAMGVVQIDRSGSLRCQSGFGRIQCQMP